MSLALRNIMRPLLAEFNDPFFTRGASLWGPALTRGNNMVSPSIDIKETDKEIIVEAETPGFKKENLSVALDKDRLVISGQSQEESNPEDTERSFQRQAFRQAFALPPDMANMDNIKATYQDGILRIRMPKPEPVSPKEITIEGGSDEATVKIAGESS